MAFITALLLSGFAFDSCAAAAERVTAPKTDKEAYEVRFSIFYTPEITKISSDEVVLEHTVSGRAMLYMIIFVCGVSVAGVILSFANVSSLELKKLLM